MSAAQGTLTHLWRSFKRCCVKAAIDEANIHRLGDTFAGRLVTRGAALVSAARIVGHTDVKSTMAYAHLATEHLKQIIKRLNIL